MTKHEIFMREALAEAQKAADIGEVPIGAIVVKGDVVVGRGYNRRETEKMATAHAEIMAIEEACITLGGWRLIGCDMYVTLEPCLMCAGAIYQSRIEHLYFGAHDPKGGAFGSLYQVHEDRRLNHLVDTQSGLLENECSVVLKDFFKALRDKKK